MTIATKNGSIIVKDGKLAENCGCCGDWYCDLTACWTCNLSFPTSGFNPVWGVGCTPQNSCKTMVGGIPGDPLPVTISVSGFPRLESNQLCPELHNGNLLDIIDFQQFTMHNGTYAGFEVCGYGGVTVDIPASSRLGSDFLGGRFLVSASFSRKLLDGTVMCPAEFVAIRVQVGVEHRYDDGTFFGFSSHRYNGIYQSPCISIESLPSSGNWLAGRTVQVPISGGIIAGNWCPFPAQTLTVSFS